MSNKITWSPNVSDTEHYEISYSSDVGGPWTVLTNITHDLGGANYDTSTGKFFYVDSVNPSTTWYRLVAVDLIGQRSLPSTPFRASSAAQFFEPGMTPFGIFDNDLDFQRDADRIVDFTRKKLGDPVMETHISSSQIYSSFEESALEYSSMVNSYQAKSVLASFLGSPTGTLQGSEQKYITQNLEMQKKMAEPYGNSGPLSVNTSLPVYSGSIRLHTGLQKYDLNEAFANELTGSAGNKLVVKQIYHFSPLSAYRFFGTTSGLNYLNSQFNFESFTPETIFYLLPIWEDILRGMQFETSNRIRRSNYSYEINANVLTLYPAPSQEMNLWITWQRPPNATEAAKINGLPEGSNSDKSYNGVANLSNVPFGNIEYSKLNSMSKQWIRKFAFALAKEIEGQIRSKMSSIPIPSGDLTLNGPELIADARAEQDRLREELKALLDETTYDKLAAKQAEQAMALEEVMKRVPLPIYIG